LASDSADGPAVLRERVTSKGGATFEALEVMRRRDLGGLMDEAMRACAARARDMGQLFG
jgi:pyrroline-5-carboxylate reductase